jgi:hypothetical protein
VELRRIWALQRPDLEKICRASLSLPARKHSPARKFAKPTEENRVFKPAREKSFARKFSEENRVFKPAREKELNARLNIRQESF